MQTTDSIYRYAAARGYIKRANSLTPYDGPLHRLNTDVHTGPRTKYKRAKPKPVNPLPTVEDMKYFDAHGKVRPNYRSNPVPTNIVPQDWSNNYYASRATPTTAQQAATPTTTQQTTPTVAEQPIVQQPVVEQPVVEQPIVEQPVVQQPVVEQPVVETPVTETAQSAPSAKPFEWNLAQRAMIPEPIRNEVGAYMSNPNEYIGGKVENWMQSESGKKFIHDRLNTALSGITGNIANMGSWERIKLILSMLFGGTQIGDIFGANDNIANFTKGITNSVAGIEGPPEA